MPVIAVILCCLAAVACGAEGYDPLALPAGEPAAPLDLDVRDHDRGRTMPIRLFLPLDAIPAAPCPVVLFSHGLGGSREGCGYLGGHWSRRGYTAVFLQHPGSDNAVWKEAPAKRRLAAMRDAASLENFRLRVQDVSAVLNALDEWNREPGHPLVGRLDLDRVGMTGHSFGAQTAQAVSGQSFPVVGRRFTDPRIKAAVIMSPGTPHGRLDPGDAFADVAIPWLLMTGTKDTAAIGGQTIESRLAVFPALPEGRAYEVVFHDAEHAAFTDRALPGDRESRNPNHHRAILAVSTAFWDAFLKNDGNASVWLDGPGPKTILEPDDRWQRK
jgi:predicted dienelactone hydrolase